MQGFCVCVARGDSERACHSGEEKREGHPSVEHREAGKQAGGYEGTLRRLEGRLAGNGKKTRAPLTGKLVQNIILMVLCFDLFNFPGQKGKQRLLRPVL